MSSSNETPAPPPGSLWLNVSSAASTLSLDCFLGGSTTSGSLHKTQSGTAIPSTPRNLSSSPRRKVSEGLLLYPCHISVYPGLCDKSKWMSVFTSSIRVHQQPAVQRIRLTTASGEADLPASTKRPHCTKRARLHHELCLSGHANSTGTTDTPEHHICVN